MYRKKTHIGRCVKLKNKHITRDLSIKWTIYIYTSCKATFLVTIIYISHFNIGCISDSWTWQCSSQLIGKQIQ